MPQLETYDLKQKAVLWPVQVFYDGYGEPQVGEPEEITCRWLTGRQEDMDSRGNNVNLEAVVVVDRKIDPGSRMWRGTLSEFLGTGSAEGQTEMMTVVKYDETPDLKNRHFYREVGLMRFRDE